MGVPLRVLIAAKQEIYRRGLRALFEGINPKIEIVGEAGSVRQLLALASLPADVILMDVKMDEEADGIEAIRQIRIRNPNARILVLTDHWQERYVREALEAGAKGYLLKDDLENNELLNAVRVVARGGVHFHEDVQEIAASILEQRKIRKHSNELTARELSVLRRLDRSNREIAEDLGIKLSTVGYNVSRVLDKLEARNRSEALMIAVARGLIEPQEQ